MDPSKLSDTSKKEPHGRSQITNQAPGTTSQWYLSQVHIQGTAQYSAVVQFGTLFQITQLTSSSSSLVVTSCTAISAINVSTVVMKQMLSASLHRDNCDIISIPGWHQFVELGVIECCSAPQENTLACLSTSLLDKYTDQTYAYPQLTGWVPTLQLKASCCRCNIIYFVWFNCSPWCQSEVSGKDWHPSQLYLICSSSAKPESIS